MNGEALWLLQTHCGRWLINKHLTNPLRNLGSQDARYCISQTHCSFIHSPFPGGKVRLTCSSWDIMTHPPSSPTHSRSPPNTTLLLLHTTWMHASGLLKGGGGEWWKSYWEIKVHQTVCVCCRSCSAGDPLICRSLPVTSPLYLLMETDANRMTPYLSLCMAVYVQWYTKVLDHQK